MKRVWVLCSLLAAFAACSTSGSADCERIAEHEFELTIKAMPAPMQARARDRLQADKRALARRCEDDGPSSEQARCELASTNLAALRRCRGGEGE
jgi:hypothetical protein